MKSFISLTFHGILDYILCIVLMASPWLFNFYLVGGAALLLPIFFGWVGLIMTIFTDYKPGLIRVFPVQMHFVLESIAGFFLLVSPWLYGFAPKVFLPHLLLGGLMVYIAIFTQKSPYTTPAHEMLKEAGITSTDSHEGRMMV